ncbi:MAG: CopA family copper-resistance protein [Planctomycetota bacterium]|jgi:CopA family copper-resistance protein
MFNKPMRINPASPPLVNPSRRRFVQGVAAGGALAMSGIPFARSFAGEAQYPQVLNGNQFNLAFNYKKVNFTGEDRFATAINGSVPAPVLRWKEGQKVTLNVTNNMAEDSSIHWHGLILPSGMDGVPNISDNFAGIKPGETFKYEFDVAQSGTYWYHSHSGFQEQTGAYGAIIIDPIEPTPYSYDREHVVVLSDWSDEDPQDIYAKLKKMSHIYNRRERTAGDLWSEIKQNGLSQTWNSREMWNQMRMSDRDISDVTGATYTFLMNGQTPAANWTGGYKKGERVLLRIINSSAMTLFDVRIPGLKMTVVAADGQYVAPVTVDEFRIGVAETYDILVEPDNDMAYSIFAQAIDRSGYAIGRLTSDMSLQAEVPAMDYAPVLTHGDMGMSGMMNMADMEGMDHSKMDHSAMMGGIKHPESENGLHVDMRAENPQYRLDDPGVGLRNNGRRVLTYSDLYNLNPTPDPRDPEREIELHLTGNMRRYMWSINGINFSDSEPLQMKYGERLRITLVNDTMMNHPMHLHGVWSDLETGDDKVIPRKHTVIVQPGSKISYRVTADALGGWAYHCHLIYHMPGMFRKVVIA